MRSQLCGSRRLQNAGLLLFTALAVGGLSALLFTEFFHQPTDVAVGFLRRHQKDGSNENILSVFTGRWRFLRINFAYIYRNLRKNGGVLDKVYYIMIQYDNETVSKLRELTATANSLLGEEVFEYRYLNNGNDKTVRPPGIFGTFYPLILGELVKYPRRKYFKMDDDIVYIHPDTFENYLDQHNASECFMHYANIGGANWRSSYIHQGMGLFPDEVNPKKLKFQFDKSAMCGWKSADCAEVALRGFFYHHEHKSLDKFLFDGRLLTKERARYSINMIMLDLNLLDFKALTESGPIRVDDEGWWTEVYSRKVKNPNCVVGKAFVVHFAYSVNMKDILKKGYLKRFEEIARTEFVIDLPEKIQKILNFG